MKKRLIKYDIARALAIMLVVFCHCTESIYSFNIDHWKTLSFASRICMFVFFTLGRLGVPLFLFLTGALILKKSIEEDKDIRYFYRHNLVPLVLVNAIWVIIYNCYFFLSGNVETVKLELIIKELFFVRRVPVSNYWYMPMIIGLYVAIPFVAKIIKSFDKKSFFIILTASFIASFIMPFVNLVFLVFNIKENYDFCLSISFFGGTYGLYIVLGYFMSIKQKINLTITGIIGLICFALTFIFQVISYNLEYCAYNVWYNFPFLLICGSCLFLIILNTEFKKLEKFSNKLITFFSKISLFTYFFHIIIILMFKELFIKLDITRPIKIIILWLVTFIICVVVGWVVSRIKYLRKYVMLIKY